MDLKYGIIDSAAKPVVSRCVGAFYASQVLSAKSGRFVYYDDSDNYWKTCASGQDYITGYVEQHMTTSSTNGGTKLPIIDPSGLTFELPYATSTSVTTQLTKAVLDDLMGKLCDLYVTGNIQYADAGVTTDSIFRIVGGDYQKTYGTLYVQVLDSKIKFDA